MSPTHYQSRPLTKRPHRASLATALVLGLLSGPTLLAQDSGDDARETDEAWSYFTIAVQTKVESGESTNFLREPLANQTWYGNDSSARVIMSGEGDAYITEVSDRNNQQSQVVRIVGRAPRNTAVEGTLYVLRRWPEDNQKSAVCAFPFSVESKELTSSSAQDYYTAKARYYNRFWSEEYAGAAVFRHLTQRAADAAEQPVREIAPRWRDDSLDRSIRLLSGGRAVSENLSLEREINVDDEEANERVAVASLEGITIAEIDWDPLLSNSPPELDALAAHIPEDQYAFFIPSFKVMERMIDDGAQLFAPLAQFAEPQSQATDAVDFYQKQIGLPLTTLTRQIGRNMVTELAVTGSDPYFRTGTDFAVLFGSNQPELLYAMMQTQLTQSAEQFAEVTQSETKIGSIVVRRWSTVDRRFSASLFRVGDAVVVSNSPHQTNQIIQTAQGQTKPLSALKEYRFFRERYPKQTDLNDGSRQPAALLVVTDAAIRRFCSPKWRIAASRRTRARATMAEMTVRHMDRLVRDQIETAEELAYDVDYPDAGSLHLTASGVHSNVYGTLRFQTPIAEMDLQMCDKSEADAYNRWRDSYQRRWRRTFDPIGLQVEPREDGFKLDLTVMPLILGSEYAWLRDTVRDTYLPDSPDGLAQDAAASLTFSFDRQSQFGRSATNFMSMMNGGDPLENALAWIDGRINVLWFDSKEWAEAQRQNEGWNTFQDSFVRELPFGVHIPSRNSFQLTAFMVGVRATIDSAAPNMLDWEARKYKEVTYTVGTLADNSIGDAESLPQLYYVTTPAGLTVSFNESIVKRSIDLYAASKKKQNTDEGGDEPAADADAIARQVDVQFSGQAVSDLMLMNRRFIWQRSAGIAWSNLPILNYLKERYPDRAPEVVYEKVFGQRLVEPAGGVYEWSDDLKSFVSDQYGSPLAPERGPDFNLPIGLDDTMQFTLSFENNGLRATVDQRSSPQSDQKTALK